MKLLLVLILLALIVLIVLVRRRVPRPAAAPERPADPLADTNLAGDVRSLRPGDMVDYLGQLSFVRGTLRLTQGGYSWAEHFIDDGRGAKRWLSVEEDPDLEVVLWAEHPVDAVPAAASLTVDGVTYRREEHGTATFRSEGTTGLAESGTVEFVDYAGPDRKYLSFERFGGAWESGLGEQVLISALTVYPAGAGRPGADGPAGDGG